ncbi:hypothetical protein BDV25DRAFT_88260 [Aspergillus avenaceus]|uniref:Fungal specific transcription factor n=1 Tax=Aspergillus avenaceus TaxID=36643 RepID=A0A5N6TE93_ASPAV|nr:hypothetical protein BDV25DRAFT_88260 [Aspergillus avenaceus]
MQSTLKGAILLNLLSNPLLSIPTRAISVSTSILRTPRLNNHITYPQCSSHLFQPKLYATMSNTETDHSQQPTETMEKKSESYLALPDANSADQSQKLDVSGDGSTVKLDHLGPLVVNQDGTLSRISNWAQMTEIEKRNTLRVLGKRNQLRMDALKAAGAGQNEGK